MGGEEGSDLLRSVNQADQSRNLRYLSCDSKDQQAFAQAATVWSVHYGASRDTVNEPEGECTLGVGALWRDMLDSTLERTLSSKEDRPLPAPQGSLRHEAPAG